MIGGMSGSSSAAAPDPERTSADGAQGDQPPPASTPGGGAAQAQPPPAASMPAGTGAQPPPPQAASGHDFLITSSDRDAAEARLRQAVADEVLDLDDFGDRMRQVLAARTRSELRAAVVDLPARTEPITRTRERGVARPAREQRLILAVMGGTETKGRWRPANPTTAVAVMGGTVVDLQGAEFEGDELTINAFALMGEVEIIVPEGVEVELGGFAFMGGRDMHVDGPVLPDAPVVRVEAYALMGGVEIRHPKPKELRRPADDRGAFADRVPLRSGGYVPTGVPRQRGGGGVLGALRRRAATLLVAAALALPLGWVLTSDQVAGSVFGSTEHRVATQSLGSGDVVSVGAPVAFGSVAIEVPEGVNVERDGIVVFGSTTCDACGDVANPAAPTVQVRTLGGFGSVDIFRPGQGPDGGGFD